MPLSTYTYQNLVDYTRTLVKGIPVTDITPLTADMIDAVIWNAFPWRWARGILTSITLVDAQQDYSYTADAATMWKILTPRVTNKTTGPPYAYRDMRVMRWLEPFTISKIAWPNFQLLCHDLNQDKLRFEAAVSVPTGTVLTLDGEYWKHHVKVASLASTIVFPDRYANVFCEGLLFYLYRFADDGRAGRAEVMRGQLVYTGQMGTFFDALMTMKECEDNGIGDTIYPEDTIGGSSFQVGAGMFNF